MEVKVFNSATELLLKFPAGRQKWYSSGRLAVTKNKMLVLRDIGNSPVIDVYDHDGGFVLRFDEKILEDAIDVTADNDGRIRIGMRGNDHCIHIFTDDGKQLSKFHINTEEYFMHTLRTGCHPEGEHVVFGGTEEKTNLCGVSIYTKDGKFVRKITLHKDYIHHFRGITVTRKGHTRL